MFPGETILSGASDICCGVKLTMMALESPKGWYIGTKCSVCGSPCTRESEYFPSKKSTEIRLIIDPEGLIWRRR